MTIIVTGGRDYKDLRKVTTVLNLLKPSKVVQGGANGADMLASQWAKTVGVPLITVEADWEKHGKAAGPIRNSEMLVAYPEALVVSFKGGKGTEDCIQKAVSRGMLVLRVEDPE